MKKKKYRPTTPGFILLILSSSALVFLLIWGILYVVFFFMTGHNRYVNVPYLSNLTWQQAIEKLDDVGLEAKIQDSSSYNPMLSKYQVIAAYPQEGRQVKKGRRVYLTINPSGYREISIPKVKDRTLREAVSIVRNTGFLIGKLEYVGGKGRNVVTGLKFLNQTLEAGTLLKKASEVTLVVNKGVRGIMTSIPDVVGMQVQTAKDILHSHSMNFRVLTKKYKSFGKVYRQYPKPGAFYPMGKYVDIWVK